MSSPGSSDERVAKTKFLPCGPHRGGHGGGSHAWGVTRTGVRHVGHFSTLVVLEVCHVIEIRHTFKNPRAGGAFGRLSCLVLRKLHGF